MDHTWRGKIKAIKTATELNFQRLDSSLAHSSDNTARKIRNLENSLNGLQKAVVQNSHALVEIRQSLKLILSEARESAKSSEQKFILNEARERATSSEQKSSLSEARESAESSE